MDKKQQLDQLNKQIQTCQRCKLADTRNHALSGEGNPNARLFLIAQAPGEVEDNKGNMFLGPSGKVLDKLLSAADISRDEIYMTNLIKCHLPKNRKPQHDEIEACHQYLDQEINSIRPAFLIPMGHYATRYLLQKYDQKIPSKHEFYKLYGSLFYIQKQKIYPVQHPAAPLHDDSLQSVLEKNYNRLSVFSQPCKWAASCPMKHNYELGILDEKWRELYCFGDWKSCIRYQKEEKNEYHEDWMLPDGTLDKRLK